MFKACILSTVFLVFAGSSVFAAFEISPVISTLAPNGPKATVSYTVINNSDTKTPIQISVFHRSPNEDGDEKYEAAQDASDQFQVVPSQIILNPKEKRTIRVTYVGEPKIKNEIAFRIISEEFPINVSDPAKVKNKTQASIAILSKYVGSIYVKPEGTVPELIAEASVDKAGKEKMLLIIHNRGTEHKLLQDIKYKVSTVADKKEFPLPPETIQAIGNQNILAGKSRKFSVPWPKGVPMVPIKIVLEPVVK